MNFYEIITISTSPHGAMAVAFYHPFYHLFCHLFCHPFCHPFCHHLRHDLVGDRLFVYRRPIYRLLGSAAYRRDHQILLF